MKKTEQPPQSLLRALRALCPARPLEQHEAQGIAERQALRLLELLEQHAPPVDVALLSELPGVEVKIQPRLPVSGFSQWTNGRWVIGVNRDDHQVRRRFTLSHEFKHVLDDIYIEHLYLDRAGHMDRVRAETICDYFAACLLMPRPWVKAAWTRPMQDVGDLAALFGVSRTAMSLRLRQLGLVVSAGRCAGGRLPEPRRYFRQAPAPLPTFSAAPRGSVGATV